MDAPAAIVVAARQLVDEHGVDPHRAVGLAVRTARALAGQGHRRAAAAVAEWDAARDRAVALATGAAPEVVELAAYQSGQSRQHLSGTAYNWKHGYIPLNVQTALLHGKKHAAAKLHAGGAPHAAPEPDWYYESRPHVPQTKNAQAAGKLGPLSLAPGPSLQAKTAKKSGKHVIEAPDAKLKPGQTVYARLPDGSIGQVKVTEKGKTYPKKGVPTSYAYTDLQAVTKRSPANLASQKAKAAAAVADLPDQGPELPPKPKPKPVPKNQYETKVLPGVKLGAATVDAKKDAATHGYPIHVHVAGQNTVVSAFPPAAATPGTEYLTVDPDGSVTSHQVPGTPPADDAKLTGSTEMPVYKPSSTEKPAGDDEQAKFEAFFKSLEDEPDTAAPAAPAGVKAGHVAFPAGKATSLDELKAKAIAGKTIPKSQKHNQNSAKAWQSAVVTGQTHYLGYDSAPTTTKPDGPHKTYHPDGTVTLASGATLSSIGELGQIGDYLKPTPSGKPKKLPPHLQEGFAPGSGAAGAKITAAGGAASPTPATPKPAAAQKVTAGQMAAAAPTGTPVTSASVAHAKLAAARVYAQKSGVPVFLDQADSTHTYVGKPPGGADWTKVNPDGSLEKGSSKVGGDGVDTTPDVPVVNKADKAPDPISAKMIEKAEVAKPIPASPQYLSENAAQALQKAVLEEKPYYVVGYNKQWKVTDSVDPLAAAGEHYQLRPDGTEWLIKPDGTATQIEPKLVSQHLTGQFKKNTPGQSGYGGIGPSDSGDYVTKAAVAQMAANLPDFDDIDIATGLQIAGHYKANVSTVGSAGALNNYTGSGYAGLNAWLRTGKSSNEAHYKQQVAALDKLMGKYQLPTAVVTKRNIHSTHFPKGPLEPGTTITDHGYVSTSYAGNWGWSGDVSFEITVPKGMNAISVDGAGGGAIGTGAEKEIILPRGTRFVIESDEQVGSKRKIKVVALPPIDQSLPSASKFADPHAAVLEPAPLWNPKAA